MRRDACGILVAVLLCLTAACTDGSGSTPTPVDAEGGSPGARGSTPTPAPETTGPEPVVDPACEPAPGREVEVLPDVTVPAVEVPEVKDADGTLVAEGYTLESYVVDGGCVVRHDAPGGCLGAVEITGASIPPLVIPEIVADGRIYGDLTLEGARRPGARVAQVCRITTEDRLAGVTRPGIVREGFSRDGGARPGDEHVATITVPPVRVSDVDVDPERLESRPLDKDVDVLRGRDTTSYVAAAGVLFASDRSDLKPDAVSSLRSIAVRLRASGAQEVRVEGHTDDRGDAGYGMRLSRARAEAVADWLEDEGGLGDVTLTTRGFGETRPAHPNTSAANRARNRRVVISVLR